MGQKHSSTKKRSRSPGSVESVDEIECVTSLPYFFADLSREQAQDVLQRHAETPGTFLLRPSSKHRRYAITSVVAKNLIGHASVYAAGKNCFYAEEEVRFESMSDLVRYYENTPLPNTTNYNINATLRRPLFKFRPPQPYPFQEEVVVYDVGPQSRKPIYDTIDEHIDQWRRRWGFEDENNIRRSRFLEEDGQHVSLRVPPSPPPHHVVTNSASPDDITVPKQTFQQEALQNQNLYEKATIPTNPRPDSHVVDQENNTFCNNVDVYVG